MAEKIPQEQLDSAFENILNGMSVQDAANEIGCSRETLSRKYNASGIVKLEPKKKVVKQKLKDVPVEELTIVNQLEGQLLVQRDENRILKTQLKEAQKSSVLMQVLAEQLKQLMHPIPPYNEMFRKRSKGATKEALVLHLSDGHHDSVVHPHAVGGLECHDFNVAMARAEHLVDTLLKFTQENMSSHEFTTLYILAYGDHTEGEIHGAVHHTHFENMMQSCLAIGQLHAQMFRDLAAWFPEIKIIYLSGNHGRRKDVAKKDFNRPTDSWDYLIAEVAKAYSRDLWNVEIAIPDSFSAVVDIEGHNFHVQHGDGIKGWNGIPWYGIERSTRRLTALNASNADDVRYFCLGHFHQHGIQAALRGETIINGSWIATNPYSYNSFAGYNEPMQCLHGVHHKMGMTWRFPLKIKRDFKLEVPQRYRVSLTSPGGTDSSDITPPKGF